MDFDDDEPEDQRSFLSRSRVGIAVIAVVLGLVVVVAMKFASGGGGSSRHDSITIVSLPPPPPPPPPQNTPPPPPPQEQKMEDQPLIKDPEPKVAEKPPEEPPLGTGIKGDGSGDSFGLGGGSGSGRIGGDGNARSKWGWYAGQVQSRIEAALRNNRRTRSANLHVDVRVWPNAAGRIARAQLANSTGDPAMDAAIRDEVLGGLQLDEPPPPGMPSPIVLRLNARRP